LGPRENPGRERFFTATENRSRPRFLVPDFSGDEQATAIANGYLSNHEGLGSAVWGGQAQLASVNTAVQINQDVQQTVTGGTRLAHGLSQAASMMEQHESDAAHSLTSFAATA
jgi:uncharacterized protein YukE